MGSRWSVVRVITYVNIGVFLSWIVTGSAFDEGAFLDGRSFMVRNFLVSWSSLVEGRLWTALTSVFSHMALLHILLNMYVLNNFGPVIERMIGPRRFIRFYLLAGVVSSLCHAFVSAFLMGAPDLPALGASGAISGLVILFSLLFPREKLLLLGLIPVPAIIGALVFVGLDLWGLWAQAGGGGLPIGHGAHLGGALCGAIYYFRRIRPYLYHRPRF